MSRRNLWLALLLGGSLLLVALILSDAMPWLRGPAPGTPEWFWPYLLRPVARWWPTLLAAGLLWICAAFWLRDERPSRRRTAVALAGLIATSLLLQISFAYADNADLPQELVNRVQSNQASGYFEPAVEIDDLGATLRAYPAVMPTFPSEHAQTHPPGLVLANWLTVRLWEQVPAAAEPVARLIWPNRCIDLWLLNRSAAVAAALGTWVLLPLLAAALTVLPAFGLARRWLHGRSIALSSVLAATVPALLLFAPKVVQFYAPLTLLLFWAFDRALSRRSLPGMLLAGLLFSGLSFLSLGNVALVLPLLVFALLRLYRGADEPPVPPTAVALAAMFALGAASIWLVFWTATGVAPWDIAAVGLGQHYTLVTNLRRYDWWIVWNLVDLLVYGGWPTVLGFTAGLATAFAAVRRKTASASTAVDALAVALLVLILVLNFSGSARGEVGRIWIFFTPLLAYPAARFWSEMLPGKRAAWLLVALQLAITISIGVAWQPVRAVAVVAQPPALEPVTPAYPRDIVATDAPIVLSGYDLLVTDTALELTLVWQAVGAAPRPYTVFTQLLDAGGSLVAQQDNWPVSGQWPPTCWRDGDSIPDRYTIALPADLPPGDYSLIVGMYDAASGVRLLWDNSRDAIELEKLTLP